MAAENRQKSEASCLHRLRNLAVLLVMLSGDIYAVTISLTCPPSYSDGQNSSVVCVVDISEVGRVCFVPVTTVTYKLTNNTGFTIDTCSSNYPACDPPTTGRKCGCTSQTTTHYTYNYTFIASKALHFHGNLTCELDCTKSQLPTTEYNGECSSIMTDLISSSTELSNATDHTSTPIYQTSTPISTLSPSNTAGYLSSTALLSNLTEENKTSDRCPTGCIVGACIGAVACTAVVVGVVIYCLKKNKPQISRNTETERTRERENELPLQQNKPSEKL